MFRLVLIFLLCCFGIQIRAQDTVSRHYLNESYYLQDTWRLDSLYGKNKTIPEGLHTEILTALMHYPELSDVKLKFKYKRFRVRATMKAGPAAAFLFYSRKRRPYVIHINNNNGWRKGANLDSISFNSLVGLIGHELGHIFDYTGQRNLSIIWLGIRYTLSKKYMGKLEKKTDLITIHHGLGYALYGFKKSLLRLDNVSEKYLNKLRRYYMLPDDILSNIRRMDAK